MLSLMTFSECQNMKGSEILFFQAEISAIRLFLPLCRQLYVKILTIKRKESVLVCDGEKKMRVIKNKTLKIYCGICGTIGAVVCIGAIVAGFTENLPIAIISSPFVGIFAAIVFTGYMVDFRKLYLPFFNPLNWFNIGLWIASFIGCFLSPIKAVKAWICLFKKEDLVLNDMNNEDEE